MTQASDHATTTPRVVPLAPEHRAAWERLYAGYAAFYRVEQTPAMRATVGVDQRSRS